MQLTSRELVAATLARDLDWLPIDRIAYVAKRVHVSASIIRDLSRMPGSEPAIEAAVHRTTDVLAKTGWQLDVSKPALPRLRKGSVEIALHG